MELPPSVKSRGEHELSVCSSSFMSRTGVQCFKTPPPQGGVHSEEESWGSLSGHLPEEVGL